MSSWYSRGASLTKPLSHSVTLSRDVIFEVLQNKRRRYAYHYLRQLGGTASLRELSDQVAAWEQDTSKSELTQNQRQRIYVSLLQSHIPHMEESGIVSYDDSEKTVTLTEQAEDLDIYLEVVSSDDIPWAEFYLGITGVSTLFLALVWLGVPPFTVISDVLWFAIVGTFGISAYFHHRYLKRRRLGGSGSPPNGL